MARTTIESGRNGHVVPCATVRPLLTAVAGGPRLEILRALAQNAADVGTLARELDLHVVTISQHLGLLRRVGLVAMTAHGCRHVYQIADGIRVRVRGETLVLTCRCRNGDRVAIQTTA